MATDGLVLNRAVVFGSAVIYWAGVWIQARRVRRRTGRSANSRPRGLKERLLWVGWMFVVVSWLALPFLSAGGRGLPGTVVMPSLVHPVSRALGVIMMAAGYAGTIWCYVAMGNAWRMGVNRTEKTDLVTRGLYRFVRHPIYLCQVVMVAAIVVLLPSVLSLIILIIHLLCVSIKAADEEAHLRALLGRSYEDYSAHTGRWLPPLMRRESPAALLPAVDPDHKKSAKPPFK
jgi:protein-S-isoprenylcysteine O-methyltransferase Ste14